MKRVGMARKSCSKTRQSQGCSCSVRLFLPCCLQHGGFVDDGRGGQSDHRSKTVFTLLTVDHALLHFTQLPSSCGHVIKSDFFVDFFFIASSDAQTTKFVDASCGFGTAGVSGTGLQELSTSSSWCGVRVLSPWSSRLRLWIRTSSMTGRVSNPTTAAKQHSLQSGKLEKCLNCL